MYHKQKERDSTVLLYYTPAVQIMMESTKKKITQKKAKKKGLQPVLDW